MNWLSIITAIAPKGKPSILQAAANAMPGMVAEFDLNTPLRQAHFLAQLAHESDGFKTTVEYASGAAYEGRADLGNTEPGDGKRFKGRGLIQLTGRSNYTLASAALGVDFVSNPALAAQFPHAIRVAGWYWQARKLNALADRDDVVAVTRKVNGGTNGLQDRRRYLARAREALAKPEAVPEAAPKTMATSKTGNAAIGTLAAGTIAPAIEVANQVKAATDTISGIMQAGPWVLLILVIVGACAFIWWDRRKKMQEHGI